MNSFCPPSPYARPRAKLEGHVKASKKEKVFAADLMHQQCWCWGQDVASAENLLLRFGFERHRSPEGPGGTRYELAGDGMHVALWGFGMWLCLPSGEQGYFARYRRGVWLLPRSFELSGVHSGRQIEPHLRRPMHLGEYADARKLGTTAALWCGQYERWVVETEGLEHRQRTLAKWKHAVAESHEMVAAWQRVRASYARWYRTPCNVDAWVSSPIPDGEADRSFDVTKAKPVVDGLAYEDSAYSIAVR
ncbi:MAG: hypothetical protein AAGE65_09775 [Planctomycetota bacterium]